MRYLSKALVHSLSWLQQEKNPNADSTPTRLLSSLMLLGAVAHETRKLDEYWNEQGGAGSEDMLGSEPMMAGLEQCGIDLNKIMTATMMITTSSQAPGDFFDFFSMLAEEGEQDCSAEQQTQYEEAAISFLACAGWNIDDGISEDVLNGITEQCKGLTDSASSMFAQPDMNALNECVAAILGDNPLGDLLRKIYHTPDKICSCVPALEDAIPTCLYSIAVPQEQMPEDMKGSMKIPLSLVKKSYCMIDNVVCAALDDFCSTELEALDWCLPPTDQASISCMSIMEKCALESEAPISVEAPPELTAAELPDACQRVYTASALTTNVPDRYRHFNNICNSAGPAITTTEIANEASALSSESSSNTTLVLVGIFLGASVVAAAYLVLRRHRARSGGFQFQQVHAVNEALTLEVHDSLEAEGIMS